MLNAALRARRCAWTLGFALLVARPAPAQPAAPTSGAPALSVALGKSIVALNGPWRFHTGDDPRWADPTFDDASWETVDLTPQTGAHDPDVGLTGYVGGWGERGHRGYSGYAWYRIRVSVTGPNDTRVALGGPLEVDQAYQLFVNGRLRGGSGRFAGATPVVYNTRPAMFTLADTPATAGAAPNGELLIAVRVWASDAYMREVPAGGGIRIAPTIGSFGSVTAHHRLEWLAKFLGYVVEVIEAAAFVLLAVMATSVARFQPANRAYRWLAVALLLTAVARANQAIFFWTTWETARTAILIRFVFADPLALGAWAMAWHSWFNLERRAWLLRTIGVLTAVYVLTSVAAVLELGSASHAAVSFITLLRLAFVLVTALIIFLGVTRPAPRNWLAITAMILVSIGLYAQEVSALGIPGIWFPYGVGVSRTQFAYAAFALVAFAMFLRRLAALARERPAPGIRIERHEAFD